MPLSVWTHLSGYSFGTFQERSVLELSLPTTNDTGVSFRVLSGTLPPGLRIENKSIVGTPFEVARETVFQFVLRAEFDKIISSYKNGNIEILNHELTSSSNGDEFLFKSSDEQFENLTVGTRYYIRYVNENELSIYPTQADALEGTNKIVLESYKIPSVHTHIIYQISDRTYSMAITGADAPVFETPEGNLDLNNNQQYYVLDSSLVDYQLQAFDFDTSVGQRLTYFIATGDGELPPGLSLTDTGKIVGFVEPVTSIRPEDGTGLYDTSFYDKIAYDFGVRSSNGFDSYKYDNIFYDYNKPTATPKKLNRNYEFIVTLTDGDSIAKRKFRIFVIGDDYFRSDNELVWIDNSNTGIFTADATFMRRPAWKTDSNLGYVRANNYVVIQTEVYDSSNVYFNLEQVNAEIFAVASRVNNNQDNLVNSPFLTVVDASGTPQYAQYITFSGILDQATSVTYQISNVASLGNGYYRLTLTNNLELTVPDGTQFYIGSICTLPPGIAFDENNSRLFGTIPYQPAISREYKFTISATRYGNTEEVAQSQKVFTLTVIGEIDSVITWNTPFDLGTINANFTSTLAVSATSTVPDALVVYRIKSGSLPAGLSLDLSGEIIGKVNLYGDSIVYRSTWKANRSYQLNDVVLYNNIYYKRITQYSTLESTFITLNWQEYQFVKSGILSNTDIDSHGVQYFNQTFDGGSTTFDKIYKFTVEARDQFGYSATTREFVLTVLITDRLTYSNIKVKPFLKLDQRKLWNDFINDSSIFTSSSIYRLNDSNFGIQSDLSMIIFAGIETSYAARYVSAIGLNNKKKRFQFGSVKKAIAYEPGTLNQVYEVIYVEMIDPNNTVLKANTAQYIDSSYDDQTVTIDKSNDIWRSGFWKDSPLTQDQIDQLTALGASFPEPVRPNDIITADSTGYTVEKPKPNRYFLNKVSVWRDKITEGGLASERNYLPLWMRSPQEGSKKELDFVLAVPLCYCKVGMADDILLNIRYSNFDFKLLDYTADRYIIDAVAGYTGDKYLVFKNERITV